MTKTIRQALDDEAIQRTVDYLYNIDADITPEQHQAIWTLRQLINEVFVKEGRQVSNQFIYDNVKGILI